jgi:hypothetical protein
MACNYEVFQISPYLSRSLDRSLACACSLARLLYLCHTHFFRVSPFLAFPSFIDKIFMWMAVLQGQEMLRSAVDALLVPTRTQQVIYRNHGMNRLQGLFILLYRNYAGNKSTAGLFMLLNRKHTGNESRIAESEGRGN